MFVSLIDEFNDNESFLEECLTNEIDNAKSGIGDSETENKKRGAKLWSETSHGGENSQTGSDNAKYGQASETSDISEYSLDDLLSTSDSRAYKKEKEKTPLNFETLVAVDTEECDQVFDMEDGSVDWFDNIGNEDCTDFNFDAWADTVEPNAKRKRL